MNYLDIYRMLNRSNCGECGLPTCMAFAMAVTGGEKDITSCPHMDTGRAEEMRRSIDNTDWKAELIESLRYEVSRLALPAIAEGIGGRIVDGMLVIKCLGRDFFIDSEGMIRSGGHINPWVEILLLHYVRTGGRGELAGEWVSFSELRGGMVKAQAFRRECEAPLREIIDRDETFFSDTLAMLDGEERKGFSSDRAWVIRPLPRVPFLLLYWRADEDFGSTLNILLDRTADTFLDVESLIFLGEGLVEMLRRIWERHG